MWHQSRQGGGISGVTDEVSDERLRAVRARRLKEREITAKWHAERVLLTERSAECEDQLNQALAMHYGRDLDHIFSLLQHVIWRVPTDERVKLLRTALERQELTDDVPFLVPALGAVFRTRNVFAHGIAAYMTETDITFYSTWRGKQSEETLGIDRVEWAVKASAACLIDFMHIAGRIGDKMTWARLHGL